MQLLPKAPREWVHIAALGVVIFLLAMVGNAPAVGWIGFGAVVVGLVGWFVSAHIAHHRQGSRAEK